MESHYAENILEKISFCVKMFIPIYQDGFIKKLLIVFYIFLVNIYYPLSVLIQLINNFRMQTFKTLLAFLASFTLIWKSVNIIIHFDKLSSLDDVIRELDEQTHESEMKVYLKGRISTANRICALLLVCSFFNWSGALLSAVTTKSIEFPAWFPFDWQGTQFNYLIAMIYQCLAHFGLIFQDTAYDLLRVIYVFMVSGHLHVLAVRVSRIGYYQPRNFKGNYEELTACIQKHQTIMRIIDELNKIISKTIFVVLIIVQVNICIGIFYIFLTEDEIYLKACLSSYVVSLFLLTALQCYFGSELEGQGERFSEAIYTSNWPEQNQKFKKTLLIFLTRSQRNVQIKAGGIYPVTLPTCLAVLKSSYSLFALLQHLYG